MSCTGMVWDVCVCVCGGLGHFLDVGNALKASSQRERNLLGFPLCKGKQLMDLSLDKMMEPHGQA